MRAKINAEIIKDEKGVTLVKVFNGYGDPQIPFVPDSICFDIIEFQDIPMVAIQEKPPFWFRAVRFTARALLTIGYYVAAPIEALQTDNYSEFKERRQYTWNILWPK